MSLALFFFFFFFFFFSSFFFFPSFFFSVVFFFFVFLFFSLFFFFLFGFLFSFSQRKDTVFLQYGWLYDATFSPLWVFFFPSHKIENTRPFLRHSLYKSPPFFFSFFMCFISLSPPPRSVMKKPLFARQWRRRAIVFPFFYFFRLDPCPHYLSTFFPPRLT